MTTWPVTSLKGSLTHLLVLSPLRPSPTTALMDV